MAKASNAKAPKRTTKALQRKNPKKVTPVDTLKMAGVTMTVNGGKKMKLDSPEAKAALKKVAENAISPTPPLLANDAATNKQDTDTREVAGARLRLLIERIETLEEEKKETGKDIRDVFIEAKGAGFDGKTIRTMIKLRKLDPQKRNEQADLLELYMAAIGME